MPNPGVICVLCPGGRKVSRRGCSTARLVLIPGTNHVLKTAPSDRAANLATYGGPTLPLAPGLVAAIAGFLRRACVDIRNLDRSSPASMAKPCEGRGPMDQPFMDQLFQNPSRR